MLPLLWLPHLSYRASSLRAPGSCWWQAPTHKKVCGWPLALARVDTGHTNAHRPWNGLSAFPDPSGPICPRRGSPPSPSTRSAARAPARAVAAGCPRSCPPGHWQPSARTRAHLSRRTALRDKRRAPITPPQPYAERAQVAAGGYSLGPKPDDRKKMGEVRDLRLRGLSFPQGEAAVSPAAAICQSAAR